METELNLFFPTLNFQILNMIGVLMNIQIKIFFLKELEVE